MKAHFNGSSLSLTTPGMEGEEEEAVYEGVRSGQFSGDVIFVVKVADTE
jgi:hypothetical protein